MSDLPTLKCWKLDVNLGKQRGILHGVHVVRYANRMDTLYFGMRAVAALLGVSTSTISSCPLVDNGDADTRGLKLEMGAANKQALFEAGAITTTEGDSKLLLTLTLTMKLFDSLVQEGEVPDDTGLRAGLRGLQGAQPPASGGRAGAGAAIAVCDNGMQEGRQMQLHMPSPAAREDDACR